MKLYHSKNIKIIEEKGAKQLKILKKKNVFFPQLKFSTVLFISMIGRFGLPLEREC